MKKYLYILLAIILISIIFILSIIFIKDNTGTDKNIESLNMPANDMNYEDEVIETTIDEMEIMKNNINSTADISIYQVEQKPSGRKILKIKPGVQFEVDLAGIVKNAKPEEEIPELMNKIPANSGVWISIQSREKFIKLLNKNNIENFSITVDGYLKTERQTENIVEKNLSK